jgi:hypothetical protein
LLYCAIQTVNFWIYGPDPAAQKRIEDALSRGPDDQKLLAIPIPGWIRKIEKPKLGRDQQALVDRFHKFTDDHKALDRIFHDLDHAVVSYLTRPPNSQYLHAVGFEPGRSQVHRTLRITKRKDPPRYINRCILVRPSGISFGWYDLGDEKGPAMERMLYPVALTKALFRGSLAFCTATIAICKAKYQDSQQPQTPVTGGPLGGIPSMKDTREQAVVKALPSSKLSEKQALKLFPFLRGKFDEGSMQDSIQAQLQSVAPQQALEFAVWSFKSALAASLRDEIINNTPGVLDIYGDYDFVGRNARAITVTIVAPYSIKDGKFMTNPRFVGWKAVILPGALPARQEQRVVDESLTTLEHHQAKTRALVEELRKNTGLSKVAERARQDVRFLRAIADEL